MTIKNKLMLMTASLLFSISSTKLHAKTIEIEIDDNIQEIVNSFKGISISGQATAIYQSSNLNLKSGDLKDSSGNNINQNDLAAYNHKDASGSFSADIVIEKRFNDNEFFQVDVQFANGQGVDANLAGGSMVNNDIMEDANNHNDVYLAKAFYERSINLTNNYRFTFDIGKFGVNDFFDIGEKNADQTTQFLNQAIANNGAFDYVQDLQGHGYTYGIRTAIANDIIGFDLGFFSADSYVDNINQKHSILAAITLTPTLFDNLEGKYQFYVFSNRGEYGAFDNQGNLITKNDDADADGVGDNINTADNADNLNKNGFGISITQAITDKIDVFAKYGKQDDDRDVRHYQDQDESYMAGASFNGALWSRGNDEIGVAYQVARLTGNHRKAHEKGYSGFFNREAGVGAGNYADESVIEAYYRLVLTQNSSLSFDAQHISNFYYSKLIGDVDFFALRFNTSF